MHKRKTCILLIIILLVLISAPSFADDNLTTTRWIVDSKLMENGDLVISEDITYDFKDKFNGVYRDIILRGTDGIKDVEIFEIVKGDEIPYDLAESANKGDANVFTKNENKDTLELMIFSPSNNEEKTFRLKYTIENVAIRHGDTGELYYKFIGSEYNTPIDYLSISIKLPQENREKTKIFAHGPLNGQINFIEDDLIKLEVSNIPTRTYVEGRILFPKEFIPNSLNKGNDSYESIINQELSLVEQIKEKSIRKEKNKIIFNNVSLVISALGALIMVFVFNKLRRNVDIYDSLKSPFPEDITPGELRLFYFSTVDARSLMTSIFNLARKGYIDIEEIESTKKKRKDFAFKRLSKSEAGLLGHEIFILDWLFNEIGNGAITDTVEIESYRKKNFMKNSKRTSALYKQVKEDLKLREYHDDKNKSYGFLMLFLSIVLFAVGLVSMLNEGFYGILTLLLSAVIFIYSILIFTRKSDKGYIQYQLWKDYLKDIKKLGNIYDDYHISIPKDKLLIYALALGLPMKSVDKFKTAIPQSSTSSHWAYWYFLTNSKGGSSFEDSLNSSFYGASGTTSSSSIGGGGGFSSGGGGGAGGGGGGGF